jgi:menaquinone-dependent protoporphyrinogen oxidase
MARFLIIYGTTEGHTGRIATHLGEHLRSFGHEVALLDTSDVPENLKLSFDGYIVAGSLHQGKHQDSLIEFVKAHGKELHPAAFLSVSLTAVIKDAQHTADAARCMAAFYEQTQWMPDRATPVAGALLYTKYDFMKRMLMRMISKKEGGDVDTSRDHEYTDWAALDAFVMDFVRTKLLVLA